MLSSLGLSRFLEDRNAELALALNPLNANARVATLTAALGRTGGEVDLDRVERSVSDALWLDAVDARLYSLLAETRLRRGDSQAAFASFSHALEISKTEVHALRRTIGHAIDRRDMTGAVRNVDLLLRRWPGAFDTIKDIFPALLAEQESYGMILDMLASDTPWRASLFAFLAEYPATLDATGRLLQDLGRSKHPPIGSEIARTTNGLIRSGRVGDAYRLFLMTLSAEETALGGYIHDGGFKGRASGRPFGWQLHEQSGHTIAVGADAATSGGAKGMRIRFIGTPVTRISAQQYLHLPPGEYVLRADVTAVSAVLPKGLFWSLRCVGGKGEMARLDIPEGSFESRLLEARFSIEAPACPLQLIGLGTTAIAESWKDRYQGAVVFNSLRVEKVVS